MNLAHIWLNQFSPATRKTYGWHIRKFQAFLSPRALTKATPEDLDKYVQTIDRDQLRRMSKAILKSFYRYLLDREMIAKNPARFLALGRAPNRISERIPGKGDVAAVCTAAGRVSKSVWSCARNGLLCRFAFFSGARRTEIRRVRVQDVQQTTINLEDDQTTAVQVELHGKGDKTRFVILPEDFGRELMAWACWMKYHQVEPLFSSITGQPLSSNQIGNIVKKAALAVGLAKFSTHYFRHAHATEALLAGCDVMTLRDSLGHDNIATTSAYLHARPNRSSALFLEKTFVAKEQKNEVGKHGHLVR